MASIIVKVPEEHQQVLDGVLALVLSFERVHDGRAASNGSLLIRIAEVVKASEWEGEGTQMSRFRWDPEGRETQGSLKHREHTIYLVKKNNKEYTRLE